MVIKTIVILLLATAPLMAAELQPESPTYKQEQILLDSADFVETGEMAYLAFPDLVRIGDEKILVSYKRGRSHAYDPGAVIEAIRFNTRTNEIAWRGVLGGEEGFIYQMGEWMEFPSGRIGNFVDVQRVVTDNGRTHNHRTGTVWTKSDDGGRTFTAMEKLGPVDGVEYGYIFDGIISNGHVYMLAMSFPELTDRKSQFNEQGERLFGQVSILASSDEGASWRHVRNLSREFGGIDINESAFIAHGDGYIVATRGYDGKARLHRVDKDFRLLEERELTSEYAVIGSQIGRPRLFLKDGELYLLGRNTRNGAMELGLFRINPDNLTVERYVVLGPDEGKRVADGYYAVPYFQERNGEALFNVITYRRFADEEESDIVRLEFLWEEVR